MLDQAQTDELAPPLLVVEKSSIKLLSNINEWVLTLAEFTCLTYGTWKYFTDDPSAVCLKVALKRQSGAFQLIFWAHLKCSI